MQEIVTFEFDLFTLRRAIGGGSYARGTEYAAQGAVRHASWDPGRTALHGAVRGHGGRTYVVTAYLSLAAGRLAQFEMGECSCPVEFNCKHVVALVLSALPSRSPGPVPPQAPPPAAWELSLDTLLEPGRATSRATSRATTPLAIELMLTRGTGPARPGVPLAGQAPLRLLARLVRPGKQGTWVAGELRWTALEILRHSGQYDEQQVRLLKELWVLYQASGRRDGYYGYQYGSDRWLEFSMLESRQLWSLLDEAGQAGLPLVYPGRRGVVPPYAEAEFCLDVTRGPDGGLRMAPVIRDAAGEAVVPVAFIGSEGHGAVCVDRGQAADGDPGGWPFRLIRLVRRVPVPLQKMALGAELPEVPAAGQDRFLEQYYPRLSRLAPLTSSDGSFTVPVISGPELVCHARYGGNHELEVSWEWSYQVGDKPHRTPPSPATPADWYRDTAAEQALLATLGDLPLNRFRLLEPGSGRGPAGPALAPLTRLRGMETMLFSTGVLPLLTGRPGLIVQVSGEPADYREAGESLQIAISADEVDGDTDWFDLGVTITVEGHPVPFLDVFVALSRGQQHLLLPDGAWFSLDRPELHALARLIEEARALQDAPADSLRISRYQAGFWEELTRLGVIDHQAAAWREQVQGLLSPGTAGPAGDPAGLQACLRPYQRDGFGWLAFLWEHQLGGILADDMGLGKTLQCLALISHARQRDPASGPFLIVAPTSVVANWTAEAARFTPDLKVVPVSQTTARRGQTLGELTAGADAVVTSYALLRLDFSAFAELDWAGLLLDEAQQAKNRQSKVYQCARRLRAPVKIAITGTPLENNLMELWSLLSITAPGLFPDPERFREYYARPVERQASRDRLAQLQQRIRPLVRRRTKEQVAPELPAKQEQVLEIDLHPQHRKVYQTRLQRERQKVLGLLDDLDANRFAIFRSLTLLRQLSLHAGLVDEAHTDLASAKIDVLMAKLRETAGGGHRALVFSQFTGFLGKVREQLEAEGMPYCYLDGRTRDRAEEVRDFKDGTAPVFLISLKAGGFGLNLTEADYCFLLDPWWNPATEAQAVDRTHRIGQTRNVMVYRLVARDTIEEKVMALKARKAQLFSSVLDDGSFYGKSLDRDDIRDLLS
ncbi:MAG: DEAD/DEAH box helicase [Streptosporangiaceae bacterium]